MSTKKNEAGERFSRKEVGNHQEICATNQDSTNSVLTGKSLSSFKKEAEKKIAKTDNHPLKFLLDDNNKFRKTKGLSHAELINSPHLVQMGHITSKKSGNIEKIMLQGAWENQFNNNTIEGKRSLGMFVENVAIDIGGIAVDLRTAKMWEEFGLLKPKGIVDSAKRL